MEEYVVIILGYFFLFLHKNVCCGYNVLKKNLINPLNCEILVRVIQ